MRILVLNIILFVFSASPPLQGQDLLFGTLTDIDDHVYQTMVIGEYEWMIDNLKVATYNNGTRIPLVENGDEWATLSSGAYCWYDNVEINAADYGALYNWYAVKSDMLCPVGWRVPTDMEWNQLEAYVDSRFARGDPEWYKPKLLRGFDAAEKLKAVERWRSGGNGTDSYSFRALPGGERRVSDGLFFQMGGGGFWWSSTEAGDSDAWFRNMAYSFDQVARNTHPKGFGFSVRCIKDAD